MAKGTQVQTLDKSTGEITVTQAFDMSAYLDEVTSAQAFKAQQSLAAAYDKACAALIGPNDVQVEKGREFKKKSAWRKLARHFTISTNLVSSAMEYLEHDYVATVVVRAAAPWGQYAEAVGACSKSEESGRRTITIADALATAETRATNRAVSNLIAMGEVSAEEMQKERGGNRAAPASRQTDAPRSVVPGEEFLPGNEKKWDGNGGKKLKDVPTNVLEAFIGWVGKQEKPSAGLAAVAASAQKVLEARTTAPDPAPEDEAQAPLPLSEDGPPPPEIDDDSGDDDLPF